MHTAPQHTKVPEENKLQRKTYDIGSFIKWFCRRTGKKKLCKADLEGPTFNLVKAFHKNSNCLIHIQAQKPDRVPNDRTTSRPLEELVPSLWVESEREYDISAVYGITHWWFRRKEFYINKHSESSDRESVQIANIANHSVRIQGASQTGFQKSLYPPYDFEDLSFPISKKKAIHCPRAEPRPVFTLPSNMWIKKPGDQESCGRHAKTRD
ncbi:hypothetical protein Tco_0525167 [Tanacetum coccineum]